MRAAKMRIIEGQVVESTGAHDADGGMRFGRIWGAERALQTGPRKAA